MLVRFSFAVVAFAAIAILMTQASTVQAQVYELRTYTVHEGKLDDLNTRFRDHTVELFEKHGMKNIGYWVPTDGPEAENTLIYVIEHESRDAAKESWQAFIADPDWQKAFRESRADGPLLAQAPESVYMEPTDYTTDFESGEGDDDAVFELRIYRCNEEKLPNLDARFRDHTIRLFKKHGIESVAYWHPTDKPDSEDTLIYIVRHASRDAAKASWSAFGADEEWRKVARESQVDGRFLRERPEAIYMKAVDYSPIK